MNKRDRSIMDAIENLPDEDRDYLLDCLKQKYKQKYKTTLSSIVVLDQESDHWLGEEDYWNDKDKTSPTADYTKAVVDKAKKSTKKENDNHHESK